MPSNYPRSVQVPTVDRAHIIRQLATSFAMEETLESILMSHCLRWLGHQTRMEDYRMPKQLLFGEMLQTRPGHGPKKRWRDVAKSDLHTIGVADNWYEVAQNRQKWLQVQIV